MRKVLNCEYPPITSYPLIANMLSVLWANKIDTIDWISDRFIQLVGRKEKLTGQSLIGTFYEYETSYNRPIFLSCPFLYASRIDRTILNHCNFSFLNFVKYCIDHDSFLHACLDQFYFSNTSTYKLYHFTHPTFIYGYDDEKQELYVRDFFNMKYSDKIVYYNEINDSYFNVNNNEEEYLNYISIFNYRKVPYSINIKKVVEDYTDYLNSRDRRGIYENDYVYMHNDNIYGLGYYDFLGDYFKNLEKLDIRAFHVLVDHKTIQEIRLKHLIDSRYLKKGDELLLQNNSLKRKVLSIRNLVLKFLMTQDNSIIDKCKELLCIAKNEDEALVKNILENLKKDFAT